MTLHMGCGPDNDAEYGRFTLDGQDHLVRLSCARAAVWSWEPPRFDYCRVSLNENVKLDLESEQQRAKDEFQFAGRRIYLEIYREPGDFGEHVRASIGVVAT